MKASGSEYDKKIEQLANAIIESVRDSIHANGKEKTGVMFSGGLDSTALACAAKKFCAPILFTFGTEGCEDLETARKVASQLGLELNEKVLTEKEVFEGASEFRKVFGDDLLAVELAFSISVVCAMARDAGVKTLLNGAGAEELFAGYHRHVLHFRQGKNLRKLLDEELASLPKRDIARAELVSKKFGVKIVCPLMDARVVSAARAFAPEENIQISDKGEIAKKIVLRDAAKLFGVPELARLRPKKAMQYGSGVHKALMLERQKFPPGARNPFKGAKQNKD